MKTISKTASGANLPLSSLEVGEVVARYLLLEELSAGPSVCTSMRTFLGLDRSGKSEVMLRVLHLAPEERDRFLAECHVARQIESRVLPEILSTGVHRDLIFVATSWRPAVNLQHLLAGGALPIEPACRILWSLCQALQDLHARGLMHADLRPGNVLFTPRGELVLMGFLPARISAIKDRDPDEELIRRYTSPEWAESRSLLPTGDIYAMGLLALEILTGRPVFPKATLSQTLQLQSQLHEALTRDAAKVLHNLPPAMHKPIRRMLEFDRSLRPVTVMNLLPILETALAGTGFTRPVQEVIQEALRYPLSETAAQLLEGAGNLLRTGRPLAATARLRLLSELQSTPRPTELQRCKDLLLDCLWSTFQSPPDTRKEIHEAICLEVHRTCERLAFPAVSVLARLRMARFVDPGSVLEPLIPQGLSPDLIESKKKQLTQRLSEFPGNEEALLGLAVFEEEDLSRDESELDLLKAELSGRWGLPFCGLIHSARPLSEAKSRTRALEIMRSLLKELDPVPVPAPVPEEEPETDPETEPLEAIQTIPAPPLSDPPSPPPQEKSPDQVQEILTAFEAQLAQENLSQAAEILGGLLNANEAEQERNFSGICSRIREFMWKSLLPAPQSLRRDKALEKVLEIARSVGFEDGLPVGERILVNILPDDEREDRLRYLLENSPHSIPILQASSRLAATQGDEQTWIRHLASAGNTFLQVGEMKLASQMFMALKALDPDSEVASQGLEETFAVGQQNVEASARWKSLKDIIDRAEFPSEALISCRGLLALYPSFVPALETTAWLHEKDGNGSAAAKIYLDLAKRSLLREEETSAKRLLRKVLTNDFGSEEALMYLATLEPLPFDAPREVWKLKVTLFEREGLFDAAIFHARQALTGASQDFGVLALLTRLSNEAGQDPSPHILAQGHLAWKTGDLQVARDCFRSAIEQAQEREGLIEELLVHNGIEAVISRQELLSYR